MDDPDADPMAAVVLAGGRARRLGGLDKAALEVDGTTFLERALAAVGGADPVVVVGPEGVTDRAGVTVVQERPAYGGPAAALLTGLAASTDLAPGVRRLAVLAVDLPGVTAGTVARLAAALVPGGGEADGAVLVDATGRRQPALLVRADRLRAVVPAEHDWTGLSLHRLLAPLRLVEVAALGDEAQDVDTPQDLRRLADRAGRGPS